MNKTFITISDKITYVVLSIYSIWFESQMIRTEVANFYTYEIQFYLKSVW